MATTVRSDPLRNFKFQVQISKRMRSTGQTMLAKAGFMSVSGLGQSTEVIPYREGGYNTTTHKLPGQSDFPPLQFQRGLFDKGGMGDATWEWVKELFFYQQGQGSGPVGNDFRTDLVIRILDHPVTKGGPTSPQDNAPHGLTKAAFKVYRAWPSTVQFSDLDAGGNAIFVEQMTLVHEGLEPAFAPAGQALRDNVFV